MRILVTGAAGFVGSHVSLELLEAGYDIICIDNFSNSVQGLLMRYIFANFSEMEILRG